MGIFLDSNIYIAFANKRDRDHKRARELMDRVRKGEFGISYTSDYVFDEAVTSSLIRARRMDVAIKVGKLILGSPEESIRSIAELLRVDEKTFSGAWSSFKTGRYEGLSFTDHTILFQMKESKIDLLLSLDTGFDGLVARIQ